MPVAGSRKFVEQRMIVVHKRERFPLQSARGRCRFGQGTFAGVRGNGRDAPIPAIRLGAG